MKMKTNQAMIIKIGNGEMEVFHKTMMGSVPDLMVLGNGHRVRHGKKLILRRDSFIGTEGVIDFIDSLKRIKGLTDNEIKRVIKSPRTGKKEVFVCLELLIYLAEKLDSDFHVMVIDTFINSKILELRDSGGDDFKTLNIAIDGMPDRIKGKRNTGLFIQVAMRLRAKIFGQISLDFDLSKKNGELPASANIWNSNHATAEKQRERVDIEDKMRFLIDMGFVSSKQELYNAIEKL